jgi:DNA-binding transcriptional regulator YiaG
MDHAKELRAKRRGHRLVKAGLLVERLEDEGLSQSDIARTIGVHPSQVSRWATGRQRPLGRHAVALLEVLDWEAS